MENEINQLNPNKAPSVDGIPTNIVKGTSITLKSPLKKLYISVENQQSPHNLKFANVTPLFKKDDNMDDEANYSPVSVNHPHLNHLKD